MARKKKNQLSYQRHCTFCIKNVSAIDYKDTNRIRRFMSSYAKIVPRRRSGVCSKHQRMLSLAVKRARIMALLPFVTK